MFECLCCKQALALDEDDAEDNDPAVTINEEGHGPTLHICEDCLRMLVTVGRDQGMDL